MRYPGNLFRYTKLDTKQSSAGRGPRPLKVQRDRYQGVAWAEMAMHNAMYESQRRLTASLDAFRLPAITNIGVA
jgi:hypothetical protein